MRKIDLPFTLAEYRDRLTKTRDAMAHKGIDLLIVTDPSNQHWLTGYDGWSFYVHQAVLVFQDQDPVWWGRNQDANGALRTVWMDEAHVRGYADHYVQSTTQHPMQDLACFIHDQGYATKIIAVEMDNYYFTAKAFDVLSGGLSDTKIKDATGLVNWQRAIKSETELGYMRKAARISEKIIDGLIERVEPGIPKNQSLPKFTMTRSRALGMIGAIIPRLCLCCRQGRMLRLRI